MIRRMKMKPTKAPRGPDRARRMGRGQRRIAGQLAQTETVVQAERDVLDNETVAAVPREDREP